MQLYRLVCEFRLLCRGLVFGLFTAIVTWDVGCRNFFFGLFFDFSSRYGYRDDDCFWVVFEQLRERLARPKAAAGEGKAAPALR